MYNTIINKIKEFDTIVIVRHVGVDPDALCSQLALRDSIRLTFPQKKVLAIGTGSAKFTHFGRIDRVEKVDNALLIICDTPDRKRIDFSSYNLDNFLYSIKIDHHPFVEEICNYELILDDTSSTCEMIMQIIDNTELKCNKDIAELLYMGLVSDSNRFLFNSCTSNTFSIVSDYINKYNINISKCYDKLYLRPLSEVRLEGYIALNMIVTDNCLGYIIITDDVINKYNVDSASAGNMINNFNFISEVLVWVTITEDVKNNQYRISIRSRGPEVNKVAEKYSGGGHKFASGIRVKSKEEALLVVDDLNQLLIKYNKRICEEK